MNLHKLSDQALTYSFYLLFFLIPLAMTPWNFELFEYNKMMLTYFLTILIAGAWLTKMLLQGRIIFKRTPFDIPLVLFLVSQAASTLFSIDQHTSIWGYYTRFNGGLLSTLSYLTLYWALASNFDKAKTLAAIRYLLAASAIVAVYGILEHFGIDAKFWVQDVQNRVFSTLGQPNWLAAYIAAIIPIPLALAIQNRKNKSLFLFLGLSVFLFFCLIFTKSRSGIPAAGLGILIFGLTLALPKIFSLKKIYLYSVGIFVFLIITAGAFFAVNKYPAQVSDIRYIFGQTDQVQIPVHLNPQGGSPSSDIRKVVWRGAVDIFKANPILGSGVETFAYSYYNFRPIEHNLLSEWDFLYNKAHNEYFNFLATTGAFGLGTYLLLVGWVVVYIVRRITNDELLIPNRIPNSKSQLDQLEIRSIRNFLVPALFSGWLSILITNFFGFSVVPIAIFFFLFPAVMVIILGQEEAQTKEAKPAKLQTWTKFSVFATLFTISYLLLTIVQYWQADTLFAAGSRLNKQGDFVNAFAKLQEAVKINKSEPFYKDELAWTAANLASGAFAQKDQALTSQLADFAINSSNSALSISPKNLNFYRTRAKVDFRLAQIDPKFLEEALNALQAANQLAPTDAKIAYNLALVQEGLGQKDRAKSTFEKTIQMKSNYIEARFMLALLYKEEGQDQKAVDQLKYIVQNLDPGNPDANQKLRDWKVK